jgi:hypothetical protein
MRLDRLMRSFRPAWRRQQQQGRPPSLAPAHRQTSSRGAVLTSSSPILSSLVCLGMRMEAVVPSSQRASRCARSLASTRPSSTRTHRRVSATAAAASPPPSADTEGKPWATQRGGTRVSHRQTALAPAAS